ncbi:hypothetical protein DFH08DRAFT_1032720 [Mycena albidolilacea]|uniref:Uncharacterized protein n=1 Tax=Mycena albidolilacea TaxID=1033008 RepID=A0AAD7EZW2_9AGAR|nr:hypothetical protein DFH08DRAFT_1032720 [Mycena albidolilacea]
MSPRKVVEMDANAWAGGPPYSMLSWSWLDGRALKMPSMTFGLAIIPNRPVQGKEVVVLVDEESRGPGQELGSISTPEYCKDVWVSARSASSQSSALEGCDVDVANSSHLQDHALTLSRCRLACNSWRQTNVVVEGHVGIKKKIGRRVGRAGVCLQFSFGCFSNPVSVLASKPFSVYLRKDPLAAVTARSQREDGIGAGVRSDFLKRIAGGSGSESGHRASFLDMAGNRSNVSLEFATVFGNLQLTFCDPRPSSTFDAGPGCGL